MNRKKKLSEILTEDFIKGEVHIGDILTYKQLCEKLNLEYISGEQKKKQLKDLSCYINFEKNGTKYTILNIYDRHIEMEKMAPVNYKYLDEFLPTITDGRKNGVYIIRQENNIYIGSTIVTLSKDLCSIIVKAIKNSIHMICYIMVVFLIYCG